MSESDDIDEAIEGAGETRADFAYRWTIRAIYAALIGAELGYLWSMWKNTPAGIETRAKARAQWVKIRDCEACARRRAFLKSRGRMMWEAIETVEGATTGDGSVGDV
jgi:hypothetical protein